jgi:hypothetical protein
VDRRILGGEANTAEGGVAYLVGGTICGGTSNVASGAGSAVRGGCSLTGADACGTA